MRNTVLIGVAVAVLVVGFVLVLRADDPGTSADPGATPTAPAPEAATPQEPAAGTTGQEAPAPEPEPEVPTVVYAGGEVDGGIRRLTFSKGDEIRFRVRSDVAEEIHVHGFDEYADVEAGRSVTLTFPAEFDGAYEVEMHGSGTQVATLEIQP